MDNAAMLLIWGFGLVLAVLWLLVPFAIFGIKPLLQQILAEQRRANAIADRQGAGQPSQPTGVEPEPQGTLSTIRAAIREVSKDRT
jgi:Na+-transporting methylmalonyl-CoA/oxaloacetate decarboxylase gamma subunit